MKNKKKKLTGYNQKHLEHTLTVKKEEQTQIKILLVEAEFN